MENGVGKKTNVLAIGAAVVLCTCILTQAAILQIEDIQLGIPGYFYAYSGGVGTLSLPASRTVGSMRLVGGAYDYSITNYTASMSSLLVQDTSSSGWASGNFQGGRTLTVTGDIKYKPTNTVIYSGTILVANMTINAAQTWMLQENHYTYAINGSVDFLPDTTIGLGQGIVQGTDVLKMGLFGGNFSFKIPSPNPTNFSVTRIMGTTSTIQLTAIPEPATITLFTIAALALRIRKKKK